MKSRLKKLLIIYLLFGSSIQAIAQKSEIALHAYSGFSTSHLFNRVTPYNWDSNISFGYSYGLAYKTRSFNFFNESCTLLTEINASYRSYRNKFRFFDHEEFVKLSIISNNTFLPLKVKDKRLRILVGVRNSIAISIKKNSTWDLLIGEHIWGITSLLKYDLLDRVEIGLSTYFDVSPSGYLRVLPQPEKVPKYRTGDLMVRVAYRIK